METVVYNNEVVEQHPIARYCCSTLKEISLRDYPDFLFDERIKALDMDTFESSQKKAQLDRTVDAVVGISSYKHNRAFRGRLLLIEFRTNYKNPRNLSLSEVQEKIQHSLGILQGDIPIERQRFLVFAKGQIERARNEVSKLKQTGGEPANWNAISLEDMAGMLHRKEDMPYEHISQLEGVFNEIRSFVVERNWDGILNVFLFWDEQAVIYRDRKYNFDEYQYIITEFKNLYQDIQHTVNDTDFDDYRELMQQDIKWLCA